jgi:hypothetical protein
LESPAGTLPSGGLSAHPQAFGNGFPHAMLSATIIAAEARPAPPCCRFSTGARADLAYSRAGASAARRREMKTIRDIEDFRALDPFFRIIEEGMRTSCEHLKDPASVRA